MPIVYGVVLKRFKRSVSKTDRGVEPAWVRIPPIPIEVNEKVLKRRIVMVTNKELRVAHLENRINKLKNNPVENEKLIRKAMRELRKLKGE